MQSKDAMSIWFFCIYTSTQDVVTWTWVVVTWTWVVVANIVDAISIWFFSCDWALFNLWCVNPGVEPYSIKMAIGLDVMLVSRGVQLLHSLFSLSLVVLEVFLPSLRGTYKDFTYEAFQTTQNHLSPPHTHLSRMEFDLVGFQNFFYFFKKPGIISLIPFVLRLAYTFVSLFHFYTNKWIKLLNR